MNINTKGRLSVQAVVAGWLVTLAAAGAHAGPEDHPSTASIPSFDDILADTRRALVLDVRMTGQAVELVEILVSDVPPGAVDDDPPLLLLEALDAGGNAVHSFHTWDPRWEYVHYEDGERAEPADEGESVGTFEIPFDHRIRRVAFRDLQTEPATFLGELDVAGVVEGFCARHGLDPNCAGFVVADGDGDGVTDAEDLCPGTVMPEPVPTSGQLGGNRWALLGEDGVFTQAPPREGDKRRFTTAETRGCSCAQVVERMALGEGHLAYGCSTGAMEDWIGTVALPPT